MERIACTQQNCSLLLSHLEHLLSSQGYGADVIKCETMQDLLGLIQEVARKNLVAGETPQWMLMGERRSLVDVEAEQVLLETPTMRYYFASQRNFDNAMSIGGGALTLLKYANVVFNKETKLFTKHRGINHIAANLILKQAG